MATANASAGRAAVIAIRRGRHDERLIELTQITSLAGAHWVKLFVKNAGDRGFSIGSKRPLRPTADADRILAARPAPTVAELQKDARRRCGEGS
jgi:hypothetical protein